MVTIKIKHLLLFFIIPFFGCETDTREKEKLIIQHYDSIINQDTAATNLHADKPLITDDDYLVDAEFVGGESAKIIFIQNNLWKNGKVPETISHGLVYVNFVVKKNGEISDVKINSSVNGGCNVCDTEAIRLIKSMPKWNPAYEILNNKKKSYYDDKQVIEIKF